MPLHNTIDPLNTFCAVCERKISVIDEWVPHGDSIAHVRCQFEAFVDWCSEHGEPMSDESHRAFLMSLEEEGDE